MVHLTISEDDAAILREVLESKLAGLDKEIWHTDHHEFRRLLTERAEALQRVLAQVAVPVAASRPL